MQSDRGSRSGGGTMRQVALIGIAALAATAFMAGCTTVPGHDNAWLSYKFATNCGSWQYPNCPSLNADVTAAINYYQGLGISSPDTYTLAMWQAANGFPAGAHPDAHAIYANLGDLQIGRDMNCLTSGSRVACYVTNYGPLPSWQPGGVSGNSWHTFDAWPNITRALQDAITTFQPLGTVAMVYDPSISGPNQVSFYAFDAGGPLLYKANLDGEGPKSVPRMCMACHGGTYDANSDTASGSSFLPFDVFYFRFSANTGYTFEDQQEPLRKLNAIVASTNPNQPILDLINGLYPGGVTNAGSMAQDGYVPPGWSDNPTLYTGVVRQYCRMCHLSQPSAFTASSNFQDNAALIQSMVCGKHDMPHAQVPYGIAYDAGLQGSSIGFWHDAAAQRDLGQFFSSQGVNSCLPTK